MNKQQTIDMLANVAEISKVDAKKYLEAVLGIFTDTLVKGEEVNLTGFGKFSVADVAERRGTVQMGENKGSEYVTPAHKAPKFKFAKNVKTLVAGE